MPELEWSCRVDRPFEESRRRRPALVGAPRASTAAKTFMPQVGRPCNSGTRRPSWCMVSGEDRWGGPRSGGGTTGSPPHHTTPQRKEGAIHVLRAERHPRGGGTPR